MVVGYEFEIEKGGARFWVELRGCGGKVGAGSLHVQDAQRVFEISRQLLSRARGELKREGSVRIHVEHSSGFSGIDIEADAVLECRPIFSRKLKES